ncbi:GAF and ANTAR domain-containing protein [Actinopolymorpha singaporensis]
MTHELRALPSGLSSDGISCGVDGGQKDLAGVLAGRVGRLFEAAAVGVMVSGTDARLRLVATAGEQAGLQDLFELQADGPCLDSYRSQMPVLNVDVGAVNNWVAFSARAIGLGIRATLVLPLVLGDTSLGTASVLATRAVSFTDGNIQLAEALVELAAIGMHQASRAQQGWLRSEQLQGALQSRVVIEQAKGMLAQSSGLSVDQAFDGLRRYARTHRLKLSWLAGEVVSRSVLPETLLNPLYGPTRRLRRGARDQ